MVVVLAMAHSSLSQWFPQSRDGHHGEGTTLLETSPKTLLVRNLFEISERIRVTRSVDIDVREPDCHNSRSPMTDHPDHLIVDLLEWLGPSPRPYSEVLDAWRTSCPRLTVWEDANDLGFIERQHSPGRGQLISTSSVGAEYLRKYRPRPSDNLEPRNPVRAGS
jgi:hypothetical protein